jgi:DNA adenine methylase
MHEIELCVNRIPNKSFVWAEPFCGSLSVPLHFIRHKPISVFFLNDANPHLIRLYSICQKYSPDGDHVRRLRNQLQRLDVLMNQNTSQYYKIRDKFNGSHGTMSDWGFVAYFYFLNRSCFNGVTSYNRSGEFNVAAGRARPTVDTLCKQFQGFHETLYAFRDRMFFSNMEYDAFVQHVERRTRTAFFYCDPPYDESNVKYTRTPFSREDQKQLSTLMKGARGPFLVHNSNTSYIRSLFKGFNIKKVSVRRSVGCTSQSRKVVNELMVTNFKF